MVAYRAYVLANAGSVLERHEFEASDDAAALERARQYLGAERLNSGTLVAVWGC